MKPTKEEIQKERAQQEADIVQCLKTLSAGGLILYPTDTVWGIGCDATDHYVVDVPMIARELIDVAVKPLTIIYEGAYNLATNVLGDQDSVGIRIPNDEFCHRLCERFGKPIVSTSANVSGAPTAKTFADIDASIVQGVDYAVQYRRDDHASRHPSNIILLSRDGTFKIIR